MSTLLSIHDIGYASEIVVIVVRRIIGKEIAIGP